MVSKNCQLYFKPLPSLFTLITLTWSQKIFQTKRVNDPTASTPYVIGKVVEWKNNTVLRVRSYERQTDQMDQQNTNGQLFRRFNL